MHHSLPLITTLVGLHCVHLRHDRPSSADLPHGWLSGWPEFSVVHLPQVSLLIRFGPGTGRTRCHPADVRCRSAFFTQRPDVRQACRVPGAIAQIAIATLLGIVLAAVLGWSLPASTTFGLSLSVASSLVVLLRTLESRSMVESPEGKIAVG